MFWLKSLKLIEVLEIPLKQFYFYDQFQRLGIWNFSQTNFMIILFWELETPIFIEELGIPMN